MEIKEELRGAAAAFRDAVIKESVSRRDYDAKRRALKDTEQSLFWEGTLNGKIDGKNVETREAQALIVFRESDDWRTVRDIAIMAEEAYRTAQADQVVALMDLKVLVVIANLDLGAMGAERLATSVELGV